MRKLLAIVVIAALAWGGYWFVGAVAVEKALAAWFDGRRADGWVADYASLDTAGFPNRFDTTITDLELSDPRSGVIWRAPMFQILTLSYKPNHIIAAFPPRQTVGDVEIDSDRMRGSVVFRPDTALTLDHSAFVAENLMLSGAGWTSHLAQGRLATRQAVARDNAHDIAFEALDLTLPAELRQRIATPLPDAIETLKIDATLAFDAPWDRFAVQGDRPEITEINLNTARAVWGELTLAAQGTLNVDAGGVATGRITVTATRWREMLNMAVAAGLVAPTLGPTLEKGMAMLAGLSGDGDTLEVPLSFQNGFVSLGPLPLGPAPRLRLN